jgi:hypothetical protein
MRCGVTKGALTYRVFQGDGSKIQDGVDVKGLEEVAIVDGVRMWKGG